MDSPELEERDERLLGRALLGVASDEEREELSERALQNPELRRALRLLEASGGGLEGAGPVSELLLDDLRLPDYLRPQELAANLVRLSTFRLSFLNVLVLLSAVPVFVLPFQSSAPWPRRVLGVVGSLICLYALLLGPWLGRRKARRIAEGGAVWKKAAGAVQRFERRIVALRIGLAVVGVTLLGLALVLDLGRDGRIVCAGAGMGCLAAIYGHAVALRGLQGKGASDD